MALEDEGLVKGPCSYASTRNSPAMRRACILGNGCARSFSSSLPLPSVCLTNSLFDPVPRTRTPALLPPSPSAFHPFPPPLSPPLSRSLLLGADSMFALAVRLLKCGSSQLCACVRMCAYVCACLTPCACMCAACTGLGAPHRRCAAGSGRDERRAQGQGVCVCAYAEALLCMIVPGVAATEV